MQEFLWLAVGCLVTSAFFLWLRRREQLRRVGERTLPRRPRRAAVVEAEPPAEQIDVPAKSMVPAAPAEPSPEPRPVSLPVRRTARQEAASPPLLATSVANHLASIASGIEGNAQLLIEAAGRPEQLPQAAERLWVAVGRLQRLHVKLRACIAPPPPSDGPTRLQDLLTELRHELQHMNLGLQVSVHVPAELPMLRTSSSALQSALLCICDTLLLMERGAQRLSINAQVQYETDEPEIAIGLDLEWLEEPGRDEFSDPCGDHAFECTASYNLISSQGGTLQFECDEANRVARALVCMPAVTTAEAAAPHLLPRPSAPRPQRAHRGDYGGVLLLEQDPAIRSLLAVELKARGRNVFACSDPTAARTLLDATPDRFELLIVDQRTQAEPGHRLAESAARLCPTLQVCVLDTDNTTPEPPPELSARLHRLAKPFGVPELRDLLAVLLPH